MRVGVVFRRFGRVVRGVMQMALRDVRMMRGGVRLTRVMARGRFPVVTCGVLMVFSGFAMMLGG